MILAVLAKLAVLFALVVAVLAPAALWFERNVLAAPGAGVPSAIAPGLGARERLGLTDLRPAAAAAFFAAFLVLPALSVIPFGGSYPFGEITVRLVVADIDWGFLYWLAYGGALVFVQATAVGRGGAPGVERGTDRVVCGLVVATSAIGLFMIFDTAALRPLAEAQDRVLWVAQLLPLPYWGVVVQPVGALLFVIGAVGATAPPPASGGGPTRSQRSAWIDRSEFTAMLTVAALGAVLFLGGFSIPFLPQQVVVAFIAQAYGEGFATGVCMLLHVGCFAAKVVGLVWLQQKIRSARRRRPEFSWTERGVRVLLPLAFANAAVTGAAILLLRGEAP